MLIMINPFYSHAFSLPPRRIRSQNSWINASNLTWTPWPRP